MKNVLTVTGIRPDFIRMSEIFKKLDKNFNHTLLHSGQHFDFDLSDIFFKDLEIRKPDYNLNLGKECDNHYEFVSKLSIKIIETINRNNLKPDIILFLGDSNSVLCSVPLKKEGYKIGHIESGMRSHDLRMFEEINRKVCDTVADFCFVYHENYKENLIKENKKINQIFNVGNTIKEVVENFSKKFVFCDKTNEFILLDIHRPENFKDSTRLNNIIEFANFCGEFYDKPVHMLNFKRTIKFINDFEIDLKTIKIIPLMGYKEYIEKSFNAKLIVSDSGTAQEEPCLLKTPVIVPRDFTERPESITHSCSIMLDVMNINKTYYEKVLLSSEDLTFDANWLGNGFTSEKICTILDKVL